MLEAVPPPCTTPWLFVFTKKKLKSAAAQVDIRDHEKSLSMRFFASKLHMGPNFGQILHLGVGNKKS